MDPANRSDLHAVVIKNDANNSDECSFRFVHIARVSSATTVGGLNDPSREISMQKCMLMWRNCSSLMSSRSHIVLNIHFLLFLRIF